jgi:hypothetical protein
MTNYSPASPPTPDAGPTCARSSLSPGARLGIAFGVLFTLKWLLPTLGVPPTAQVLVLLVAATMFVWRFWWHCSPDRRGALLLGGLLWVAGLFKIALR